MLWSFGLAVLIIDIGFRIVTQYGPKQVRVGHRPLKKLSLDELQHRLENKSIPNQIEELERLLSSTAFMEYAPKNKTGEDDSKNLLLITLGNFFGTKKMSDYPQLANIFQALNTREGLLSRSRSLSFNNENVDLVGDTAAQDNPSRPERKSKDGENGNNDEYDDGAWFAFTLPSEDS